MLGVDRLDMIKGIPQKILAFEKFLEENAYWRDKVVLLQIAVPTRTDVPECMLLFYLRCHLHYTTFFFKIGEGFTSGF
jgi:trehalose-6-phosphate synthase